MVLRPEILPGEYQAVGDIVTVKLNRPLFLPIPHIPEHPFVTAGGHKMPDHGEPDFFRLLGCDLIRNVEHGLNRFAETLSAIGVDPALIQRVGRSLLRQYLANLPV